MINWMLNSRRNRLERFLRKLSQWVTCRNGIRRSWWRLSGRKGLPEGTDTAEDTAEEDTNLAEEDTAEEDTNLAEEDTDPVAEDINPAEEDTDPAEEDTDPVVVDITDLLDILVEVATEDRTEDTGPLADSADVMDSVDAVGSVGAADSVDAVNSTYSLDLVDAVNSVESMDSVDIVDLADAADSWNRSSLTTIPANILTIVSILFVCVCGLALNRITGSIRATACAYFPYSRNKFCRNIIFFLI